MKLEDKDIFIKINLDVEVELKNIFIYFFINKSPV